MRIPRAPQAHWPFRNLLNTAVSPPAARSPEQAGPGTGCSRQDQALAAVYRESPGDLKPACLTVAKSHTVLVKGGAGSLATTKEITTATRPPVGVT